MAIWTIESLPEPQSEAVRQFERFLLEFNDAQAGKHRHEHVTLIARDASGEVVGGLSGSTSMGWLFIKNLAVQESARGSGVGKQLVAAVEVEASRRGCHSAYLDTFSFQARPFYEKLGYEVFGTLDNYPEGHKRFFLKKRLR